MDAGEFEAARAWHARACRLAPADPTPKLSLAGACLACGLAAEAAELFREVAERIDARAAWLGLAAASVPLGDAVAAVFALQQALSRHAGGLADGSLVDAVARAAGYPGWCALDGSGRLVGRAAGPLRLDLDGRRLTDKAFGIVPPPGSRLRVHLAGRPLLGSPIGLGDIRRVEGLVEVEGNGLSGWAWHPGDPARDPVLTLSGGGVTRAIRAADRSVAAPRPLTEPRGFVVSARDLAGLPEPIEVRGSDGTKLAGSPVSPRALAAVVPTPADAVAPFHATAARCPDRPVAVVVPVYRGVHETAACLHDVLATLPGGSVAIVVDDASPEPALVAAVDALAAVSRVRLLRHAGNLGFPAAANAGLRVALTLQPPHDVVLLNSDTRMGAGWVERLRAVVQGSGDIGSATPLSNDATIASYPDPAGGNPPPSRAERALLSRLARQAAEHEAVDVPTGIGFCLYLRHECLTQTGLLREDVFAQGYGEENDFCLRARRLGWRHVIAPGAYVAHVGGRSFGAARTALLARNLRVLERLHPGYRELVDRWIAADPLAPFRRRLDLLRWGRRARREIRAAPQGGVLLVSHDEGGGVERCVQERVASLRGLGHWPILLRPVLDRRETPDPAGDARQRRTLPGLVRLDEAGFPNLVFRLPDEQVGLEAALHLARPAWMEVHHLLGHDHSVLDLARRLAIPYDMRLHDYAAFCPRITLTASADRYCGEPDVAGCVACVAAHGTTLAENIAPPALRARSAADLGGAGRVVVPSADMAARMGRHFPGLATQVVPHEADAPGPLLYGPQRSAERVVVVVGAIGRPKGFDVLLACARDAAARRLKLRFVVVGRTADDAALLETGHAHVTGPYAEGEAARLITEQGATVGFLPSLWPETWCFALGEMLRAGLAVAAFDIGAQAERIRCTGLGWLLPLGAPAEVVNRLLLAPPPLSAGQLAVFGNKMQTARVRVAIDPRSSSESSP